MKGLATFALIAFGVAPLMPLHAGGVARVTLTIRLYNTAGVQAPELASARDTARSILGDSGVDVSARHCGRAISGLVPVDPCSEPLKPAEIVVRIIDAPVFNTALDPDAFGVTYIVRETDRGWLATVFADRIGHAAARAGIATGTLLGRVMAHEVGHLLLGGGYHGRAGVMRAEWPDATLTREGADWRFSVSEAARMHLTLTSLATETHLPAGGSDKVVALSAPNTTR